MQHISVGCVECVVSAFGTSMCVAYTQYAFGVHCGSAALIVCFVSDNL